MNRATAERIVWPRRLRLANISNGLVYAHDDVCFFQSQHGHHRDCGYFRMDAMPHSATIHLLTGGLVEIIDATHRNKPLTDALRFGVPTWCLVFNRALGWENIVVCDWQTPDMVSASAATMHSAVRHVIRRLADYYGAQRPCVINENVFLTCHRNVRYDDKPDRIRERLYGGHMWDRGDAIEKWEREHGLEIAKWAHILETIEANIDEADRAGTVTAATVRLMHTYLLDAWGRVGADPEDRLHDLAVEYGALLGDVNTTHDDIIAALHRWRQVGLDRDIES